MGATEEGLLHAAMLIAQGDLQMEDPLAVALEPEVARLDHARVDGPHGHLVDLLALHAEEVDHTGNRHSATLPGVRRAVPGKVESHGLQPGMAFGDDAGLLGELPLEEVGLGAIGREGGIARSVELGAQDTQDVPRIVREHGVEAQVQIAAEAGEAVPFLDAPQDGVPERTDGQLRHLPQGQALAVAEDRQISGTHGCTSIRADKTPSTEVAA